MEKQIPEPLYKTADGGPRKWSMWAIKNYHPAGRLQLCTNFPKKRFGLRKSRPLPKRGAFVCASVGILPAAKRTDEPIPASATALASVIRRYPRWKQKHDPASIRIEAEAYTQHRPDGVEMGGNYCRPDSSRDNL